MNQANPPLPAAERLAIIRQLLQRDLRPRRLEVIDESHLHAGHAGARDGRGHFRVLIESPAFAGKSLIQRHRQDDPIEWTPETLFSITNSQTTTPVIKKKNNPPPPCQGDFC